MSKWAYRVQAYWDNPQPCESKERGKENDDKGEEKSEEKVKCFCEVKKEHMKEGTHKRRMEVQEKNGKKEEKNGRAKINVRW